VIISTTDEEAKKKIIEHYTGYNFTNMVDWEKPVRAKRVNFGSVKKSEKSLSMIYNFENMEFFSSEVDLAAGGLIVSSVRKTDIKLQSHTISRNAFDELSALFFKDIQIISPKKTVRSKLGDNWFEYSDVLKEKIIEYFNDENKAISYLVYNYLSYEFKNQVNFIKRCSLPKDHWLKQTHIIADSFNYKSDGINRHLCWVINALEIDTTMLKNIEKKLGLLSEKINDSYPLMRYMREADIKEVTKYILMSDNYKEVT
jgi:hypothetical protein